MRKKLLWAGVSGVTMCLIVLGVLILRRTLHAGRAGQEPVRGWARDIQGTTVTPHLEGKIVPGENVVWCSTFQLAWNELCDLTGGPIQMENPPAMVPFLNRKEASKEDLNEASYVAMAGLAEDGIHEKIRKELDRKFHGQANPAMLNSLPKAGWVTYAYLSKDLPFEWAFTRFRRKLSFEGRMVDCFGIQDPGPDEAKMASQVAVLDYQNNDDLIVELRTKASDERLILAKVPREPSLGETVAAVQQRIAAGKPSGMEDAGALYIPILDFELFRDYQELDGHPLKTANGKLHQQKLAALQSIRFRLDERGAILKSEGWASASKLPRAYIFNKPFLILLKRRDAENPYFAMWVGNADLMVATGKAKKGEKH